MASTAFDTHDIFNQSPPYEDVNLFSSDRPLQDAVAANGAGGEAAALSAFGRRWGTAEMFELARQANENPPKLEDVRRQGLPARHGRIPPGLSPLHGREHRGRPACLDLGAGRERPRRPRPGRARGALLHGGAGRDRAHVPDHHDAGCGRRRWRSSRRCAEADAQDRLARIRPAFPAMVGEGRHHARHGHDREAGRHRRAHQHARARCRPARAIAITGHKWFMSAPMCDAFLVLAQAPGGLTCFLMPRFRPDGTVNALRFQRLKDKLGNRSNASSEVEFAEAFAWRVGEEGRGVRTIIQMVQLTRARLRHRLRRA